MDGRISQKFENRAIKSGRNNSIHITKIDQFTVILHGFGGSVVMLT